MARSGLVPPLQRRVLHAHGADARARVPQRGGLLSFTALRRRDAEAELRIQPSAAWDLSDLDGQVVKVRLDETRARRGRDGARDLWPAPLSRR